MTAVDVPWTFRCELGEGPHWDATRGRLLFVDINAQLLHRLDPVSGDHRVVPVAPYVSFAIPIAGTSDTLCATQGDLVVVGADGNVGARRVIESGRPAHRLNDGKADPAGRVWCGSMGISERRPDSSLHRIDANGARVVLDGITLSNGLAWDLERERMYYIDSPTGRVDVLRYDHATGEVEDRRPFVEIAGGGVGSGSDIGVIPDGMTIDADGCVWVAVFGGGQLRRFDPDGALMTAVDLPVAHPTSLAFGGPDLSTLFVTTSRHRLSIEERATSPTAGALLVVDAGIRGRPAATVAAPVLAAIAQLPVHA